MLSLFPIHSSRRTSGASFVTALAATAIMLATSAGAASAAFSYQGVLKNASNEPLTGNQTIELRLYTSAEEGSPVWGRTYNVLVDTNGLFNIEVSDSTGSSLEGISSTATLPAVFAKNADTTLHIGIKVSGTSGEIRPRQTLLAVPYATFAANVANASGDLAVGGNLTASSVVVSNDVAAGSLTVAGALGAASLTTSGTASVGGDLVVGGSLTGFGVAPVGSIILWSGAVNEIPTGWALCNGENNTPNLRNRFVVGAGQDYAVGDTGGANEVTLTVEQMPSHSHSYSFNGADLKGSWDSDNYFYNQSNEYPNNGNRKSTNSTGGGKPHENRPPYYALCYIMRVK